MPPFFWVKLQVVSLSLFPPYLQPGLVLFPPEERNYLTASRRFGRPSKSISKTVPCHLLSSTFKRQGRVGGWQTTIIVQTFWQLSSIWSTTSLHKVGRSLLFVHLAPFLCGALSNARKLCVTLSSTRRRVTDGKHSIRVPTPVISPWKFEVFQYLPYNKPAFK